MRLITMIHRLMGNAANRFVIVDARDNSVTLSRQLCREIDVFHLERNNVLVFRLSTGQYAFAVNPDWGLKDTQYGEIQYNERQKCIGFETLCPTVTRMLYDYGIDKDVCKLSVIPGRANGKEYYIICNPNE